MRTLSQTMLRLVRREARVEPLEQALRDALLLAQQRAAARLGGVRGEHRLDGQAADELEHLGGAQAPRLECRDRVLDAAGLRPLAVLEEVVAAAADAMHLLGEVDRLEPGREGAHQVAGQRRRPVAHQRGQLRARAGHRRRGARIAATRSASTSSNSASPPCSRRISPDQRAQGVHVIAQRLVLGREVDVAAVHAQSFQVLARAAKSGRCGRTTQKRCPVGASMTYQVRTAPDARRAEPLQAAHLGLDVVRLDVQVHAARVLTCCTSMCG